MGRPLADRPYPFEALREAMACQTPGDVGRRLGVSGRDLYDAVDHGLSDVLADRWAIRAGLHPELVWPGWTDDGLAEIDRDIDQWWRPAWLHRENDRGAA